ncbi:MAG: ABC transporter permease [Candidatus Paceibacterota bacterium]
MARKIKNIALGSIPFLVVIIIWFFGNYFSFFPRWMIPSPFTTAQTFFWLIKDGTLLQLAWGSIQIALVGFGFATIVAVILGILIGSYPTMRKIFFPFFSAVYIVPSLAWLPVIILILGFTKTTVICIVFLSSFKKIIYNVVSGVRSVNISWILAGKNIGLNKFEITYKIIIPAALPQIITGLRMGFASAWRTLIGAEMLVSGAAGLGRFIWNAQWFLAFDKVFSGIIIIALIGMLAEQFVFKPFEDKTLIKWGLAQEEI